MPNNPGSWMFGRGRSLSLGKRPLIMGILNVTPDSFSDGALFDSVDKALERALQMVEEGADIIDIGGESTRPGAPQISEYDELSRVIPVVEKVACSLNVPISVDTTKSKVARLSLQAGAEIINDISGGSFDPLMFSTAAEFSSGLVLMHTRGKPDVMQNETGYSDIISEINTFLESASASAMKAGVSKNSIVVDPGIGFGKDLNGNLSIMRNLESIRKRLKFPILLGTSRKSFIGTLLGLEVNERIFGTAATVATAVIAGVDILRVHDVKEMRQVADMTAAICGRWMPESIQA